MEGERALARSLTSRPRLQAECKSQGSSPPSMVLEQRTRQETPASSEKKLKLTEANRLKQTEESQVRRPQVPRPHLALQPVSSGN